MKQLFFILIFLPVTLRASAVELTCPKLIETDQSLRKPVDGWVQVSDPTEHYLNTAIFSEGHPSEHGFLHPDQESGGVQWAATWQFQDSSKIWFSCQYRGTSISLAQQLPAGLKQCTITGNNSKGIKVSNVLCQ